MAADVTRKTFDEEVLSSAELVVIDFWAPPEQVHAPVTIYTLSGCGYCWSALGLLRRRGIGFSEISGDSERGFRHRLLQETGGVTVPQVIIDGDPIGGARELRALDRSGVLIALVSRGPFPFAVVRRRLDVRSLFAWLTSLLRRPGGPWSYVVEVVDADGRILDRHLLASLNEADLLAQTLNADRERGVGSEAVPV